MGYLLNDNLIWIVNPKCASFSIENSLLNSNLKLKKYFYTGPQKLHYHVPLDECLDYFGRKESVCITRDWFDKWLSALNFIWYRIEFDMQGTPICKWEDINNEIIYNIFDDKFINKLYSKTKDCVLECFMELFKKDTKNIIDIPVEHRGLLGTLISESYWKSNQKCTYEFDIKKLNQFVDFIEDRFGEKLIIENKNVSTKRPNKIIINDELKAFVWERFEKPFEKRNQLI
jgi:hypothetical protein